ncbi:MAG: hypothetical protein WBM39_11345 [Parasphingorhabdus sp.]
MKKTKEDKGLLEREEPARNETEIKRDIEHSKEFARDRLRTPEWAVNYKPPAAPFPELVSLAKKIARLRRIRDKSLGNELTRSGEPVWNILIELVIAAEEQKQISLADLSDLVSLPDTIAIRYLNILENTGFIAWGQHPSGQRNDQLHLTNKGRSIIRRTLLALEKD